jgi:hypothetical protein
MMLANLLGRITGGDKKKALPDQQASVLGRLGDYIIIYPYGMHCDLPDDVWLSVIGEGKALPVTSFRPDAARGDIVLFNPITGDKINLKKIGGIDAVTDYDINALCKNANIKATTKATVTAPDIDLIGNVKVTGTFDVFGNSSFTGTMLNNGKDVGDTHGHAQENDSGGNTEQNINGVL